MAEYKELILRLRKDAEFLEISSKYNNTVNEFAERISQAADVIEKLSGERKNGKWEFREEFFAYGIAHFDCSLCGESVLERTFFCPNCGADMRGET